VSELRSWTKQGIEPVLSDSRIKQKIEWFRSYFQTRSGAIPFAKSGTEPFRSIRFLNQTPPNSHGHHWIWPVHEHVYWSVTTASPLLLLLTPSKALVALASDNLRPRELLHPYWFLKIKFDHSSYLEYLKILFILLLDILYLFLYFHKFLK
jgi:hypothetical protein